MATERVSKIEAIHRDGLEENRAWKRLRVLRQCAS